MHHHSQPGMRSTPPQLCVKCKKQPHTVNVMTAVYCDTCFMEHAHHKFRMCLAKARTDTRSGRTLVALGSTMASFALLHMTQLPQTQNPQRRNLDDYVYLHIEADADSAARVRTMVSLADRCCQFIPLDTLDTSLFGEQRASDTPASIAQLLAQARDEPERRELVRIFQRALLLIAARSLGCTKILLADTNSSMATDVMCSVCNGRGDIVPWLMQPAQVYPVASHVAVVRPLRDHLDLEISHYVSLLLRDLADRDAALGLSCWPRDTPCGGIHELTADFMRSLDRVHAATASTVTRTASKVATGLDADPASCVLCLVPQSRASPALCVTCQALAGRTDRSSLPLYTRSLLQSLEIVGVTAQ